VSINNENGIATIEFFHPAHNSLPGEILSKLAETITSAGNDESVKVIVLKAVGIERFVPVPVLRS
jgi:methylglutaconyl-CoA hydratase